MKGYPEKDGEASASEKGDFMKRHCGKKTALVLALSLILANYYVEYGRKVRASETEQKMEFYQGSVLAEELGESESESETESERETEEERETEAGPEAGNGREAENRKPSEKEREIEAKIQGTAGMEQGMAADTEEKRESETKAEPEMKAGAEAEKLKTGTEIGAEAGTETEESETGADREAEAGTETEESKTEADTETEAGTETEEPKTEADTETEAGTETEESETEADTETEAGTETEESETEAPWQGKTVRVFHIEVKLPEQGRIYDGTDQIELSYETEGMEEESGWKLRYQARLMGTDVGEWPVQYEFWLENVNPADTGSQQENSAAACQLQVEQQPLSAVILPRTLSVEIPDGWKAYGKTAEMKNIHLSGKVKVTGFIRDAAGNEVIPDGFEAPWVAVDTSVVSQWSHIYESGIQKVYQDALVMKYRKNGKPTGNPTSNYIFSEDEQAGGYRKGKLLIAQSDIAEGIDYEIIGEEGAIYRRADNTVWVRQGSGLQILPMENRGYTEGWASGPLSLSGTAVFSLTARDGQGQVTAVSLEQSVSFQVDGVVPEAIVEISGVSKTETTCYGKGNVYVQIRVPEDKGSGIKQARYFVAASREALPDQVPESREWWQDCTSGLQLRLEKPGSYVLYVETEDWTGNKAYVKSRTVVIDGEKPEIMIEGVEDNSANSGSVYLTIRCRDDCYRSGSLKVEITGANGTYVPARREIRLESQGEMLRFADFARTKSADDIYTVTATAEDLAGNCSTETVTFSINRFGSVYDLSSETKKELEQFYHKTGFPVTFQEINLDYVGSVQILCRREGNLMRLKENQDYVVSYSGAERGWKQYTYTIPAEFFQKEGSYEVMMISRDRAQNSGDSQSQRKTVRFAVDRSAPECQITGLEANQVYQAETMWICLEPRDNLCLKEMAVYQDGRRTSVYSQKEIQEQGGVIKWQVTAKERWQRLEVRVADEAGNQTWTEELPFYITAKEDMKKILPYIKSGKTAREREAETRILTRLNRKLGKLGIAGALSDSGRAAAGQPDRGMDWSTGKAGDPWIPRGQLWGLPEALAGQAQAAMVRQTAMAQAEGKDSGNRTVADTPGGSGLALLCLMGVLLLTALYLSVGIRHFRKKA